MTNETMWMGMIPESWKSIPLKYVFDIQKRIAGKEGYTVLSITQSGIKPKNMDAQGQYAQDYSNYQLVYPGDFAMNHMDLLTGWVDISQYEGVTSPDYRVFVNRDANQFCSEYYKYVFQYCYSNKVFYGMGQGVSGFGRWRLPADMFLNFRLPVPRLDEQKRIATFLEQKICDIDVVISEAKASIEEYKAWKASIIYEAVTKGIDPNVEMKDSGIVWIGKMPVGWSRTKLSNCFAIIGSGTTPTSDDNSYYEGNINWLQSGDINGGSVCDTKKCISAEAYERFSALKIYKAPFLVIAMYGASIANTSIVEIDACTNQACCVFCDANELVNLDYAFYSVLAAKEHLLLAARGGTQPNINQDILKKLMIPIPPKAEQEEIVGYLKQKCNDIGILIAEKEALIADLESYKKALIFEVVTGKRRVTE